MSSKKSQDEKIKKPKNKKLKAHMKKIRTAEQSPIVKPVA